MAHSISESLGDITRCEKELIDQLLAEDRDEDMVLESIKKMASLARGYQNCLVEINDLIKWNETLGGDSLNTLKNDIAYSLDHIVTETDPLLTIKDIQSVVTRRNSYPSFSSLGFYL